MKDRKDPLLGPAMRRQAAAHLPGDAFCPRRPRGLSERVVWRPVGELKLFPGNPRRHPEAQIARLMKSIARVWTNPLLIDETATILAGHARLEAAKRLGRPRVPTVAIVGLSESEKRAVVIADNRLPEQAVWDFDILKEHFKELIELDFEVELTGFSTGEIELVMDRKPPAKSTDPADHSTATRFETEGPAISQLGDIWQLGRHRLICGDALSRDCYGRLLQGDPAQMVITDHPYNVPIDGPVTGRGKVRDRELKVMPEPAFTKFLERSIHWAITFSRNGSIHYLFVDWRHLPELLNVARPLYAEWKDVLVWNKSHAVRGSFYGSKHELIAVFKNGAGAHIQNFGRGHGRHRANVLDYAEVNGLKAGRQDELDADRMVKPVGLIADLIRDCSRRNGINSRPIWRQRHDHSRGRAHRQGRSSDRIGPAQRGRGDPPLGADHGHSSPTYRDQSELCRAGRAQGSWVRAREISRAGRSQGWSFRRK